MSEPRADGAVAPARPSRAGRVLDVMALAAFAVGAWMYGSGWLGLRELRSGAYVRPEGGPLDAASRFADHSAMLARDGGWVMIAALAIGVVAWLVGRRAHRAAA